MQKMPRYEHLDWKKASCDPLQGLQTQNELYGMALDDQTLR